MCDQEDLTRLLQNLRPELREGEFVFACLSRESFARLPAEPLAVFREGEGVSVVLRRSDAEAAGVACAFRCRLITLSVHSSLHAVGLLAAVATKLAAAGISLNAVSAFHHDHLFVPAERAKEALSLLAEMGRSQRPPDENSDGPPGVRDPKQSG